MNVLDCIPLSLYRFWRWHPEVALRYMPIVRAIRRFPSSATILEVGSGPLGISPYLGRSITGVDQNFDGPSIPYTHKIKGDATDLPFKDQGFDIVISVDMLEHMSKEGRKKAIQEMVRVARQMVAIGVPSGKEAEEHDKEMDNYYKKIFGHSYHFLVEQIGFGLPKKNDIVEVIERALSSHKRSASIRIENNESIQLRTILMKGWMTKNPIVNIIFRKLLLPFVFLFQYCNWQPAYRKIFIVSFSTNFKQTFQKKLKIG